MILFGGAVSIFFLMPALSEIRVLCNMQEFWLEKSKGRVCMALSSKALVITGIDDRRYWTHIPTTESR
jgi:hypothetical protein